jgi:hypothetical protein
MNGILGMIDPTITAGNIIEICSIVGGGIVVLFKMNSSVIMLKADVASMQKEIVKIGDVLTKLAIADTRLNNIERDIRELRHGEGFVRGKLNRSIDGEYS